MLHPQYLDHDSASLFAGPGGGSMPTQAADSSSSNSKGRSTQHQGIIPATVKQIAHAFASSSSSSLAHNSTPTINGLDLTIFRLLGMVTNKVERLTHVSFTIDDGTGKINFNRWVNDASDTTELQPIQNGMYVRVHADLKGFQANMCAYLISARPMTDFNDIVLHFLECTHTNLLTAKLNMLTAARNSSPTQLAAPSRTSTHFAHTDATPFPGSSAYQASFPNQPNQATYSYSSMDSNRNTMVGMVLDVFQDPTNLRHEHGLHIDDVIRKLGVPRNTVLDAVNYLVDMGHIYSTIDDNHFKSAQNY